MRQHGGVNPQGRIHECVGYCFSAADLDFVVPGSHETVDVDGLPSSRLHCFLEADQLISPLHLAYSVNGDQSAKRKQSSRLQVSC